jgi:hypothetical protein
MDAQDRHLLDDTDQGRRCRGETVKNTLDAMRKRLKNKKVRVIDGPFTSFPRHRRCGTLAGAADGADRHLRPTDVG